VTAASRLGLAGLTVLALGVTVLAAVSNSWSAGPTHRDGTASAPVTYYVSPAGSDSAAGTSPATAWRTLGRASAAQLRPGARLLLQGGRVFTGQLTIDSRDAGSTLDPVTVGSYGTGEATIFAPTGSAVFVHDTGGVDIRDLRLAGKPGPAAAEGINVYNDRPTGHRFAGVSITRVDVSYFLDGITVGGPDAGFSDVRVTDCDLHSNTDSGLLTYGPVFNPRVPVYANQDVTVSGVTAARNPGDPRNKKRNSGNGIVLGSVTSGSITWSTASDNGGQGGASEGPAGIWAYDSTGIDIAHDLSYGNHTRNRIDGNGFGLDQNTSDSVLQDNFSYGNDGTGYLVYSRYRNGGQHDNVVRDNISSGDARDGNPEYGGVTVIGWVRNAVVYQNTVVMTSAPAGQPPLLRLGPVVLGVSVRDNLFTTDADPLVAASSALPSSAVLLQGNDYYSADGAWSILWGQTVYDSLTTWRAGTGQETMGGGPTGLAADPLLTGPVLGLSARTPRDPGIAAAFTPRAGSPLIGSGLGLSGFGIRPPASDYAGHSQSPAHPNVGAL
jgi:hypothetical protein